MKPKLISKMKLHRFAFLNSAVYFNLVLPWLFDPLKTEIKPGTWDVLRDNPGLMLAASSGFKLIPRV